MKPSFTEKYATALLIATAVLLVGALFAVERFQMLPLQGQATPMYGSMPTPVLRKRSSSSAKPSRVLLRKTVRKSSKSSVPARSVVR
ncbi:hypothetical protein K8942_00680 [Candidatus Peribacteria bacterium]|nr:MAG: hypothetical protein K8942_00680 [Candidatus Peribacteria bacterium]